MKQKFPKTVKELLKQGEDDGFIVQDDIFLFCSEPEKQIEQIDEFFDSALKKGIDVFETISTSAVPCFKSIWIDELVRTALP